MTLILTTCKIMERYNPTFQALAPEDIQQSYPDTCAIKAQQIILEQKGISVSEDQLVQESIDNGWYRPGTGTSVVDVGKLLELHGLEVECSINGSIDDLADSISKGNAVIIGVDSGELWHNGPWEELEDWIFGPQADHALIASGVVVNPLTGEQEVLLTDPGTGEVAHPYNLDTFLDAWDDSNNFMLTLV